MCLAPVPRAVSLWPGSSLPSALCSATPGSQMDAGLITALPEEPPAMLGLGTLLCLGIIGKAAHGCLANTLFTKPLCVCAEAGVCS